MPKRLALTGNYAVSYAVKAARVKVIAAYPITPQTTIVEKLAEMIESGELDAVMIRVESEHSALAAVYGAAAGGVRAFTATASHGLLYMHEVLWWVAASRIPVVMAIVTRAIGPPWNIHVDHNDILDQRDTGWIIAMAEDNQEAFDLTLLAFRISEDEKVFLPAMVGLDGFILSHTVEPVEIPDQQDIDAWLPPRKQPYVIEPGNPISMGNIFTDEAFEEMRMDMQEAMRRARDVIREAGREYGKITGRYYDKLIDCYKCNDADYLLLGIGSWMGDAKIAVDMLRDEGIRAGVAKLWYVRPFPWDELRELALTKKLVIVFDRGISMGHTGQLFMEASSALEAKPSMVGVMAGVGGVDIGPEDFANIARKFIAEVEERGRIYSPGNWYHLGSIKRIY
ncbi:MAG: transketolase C-terminal domain-containing protein [Pyrodictiaceae archaeon]